MAAIVFVGATLIVALVAVATGWESWVALRQEASGFPWTARPLPLVLALTSGIAALLATGRVWAAMFGGAGGRSNPREAVAAWLGSNLGRYIPGKVWQLTGITAWFNVRGDSGAAGFATSLALQAIMLATGTGLGLALGGAAAIEGVDWRLAAGAGLVLLILLHPRVLNGAIRRVAHLLREAPPDAALSGRAVVLAALASIAIWGLYGVGLSALVAGLAPTSPLPPHVGTGVFAAAYVAGYVVLIAPGGLVVREGALTVLLVATTGMPAGAAAAVAVAARVWSTLAELAAFGLATLGLRRGGAEG